MTEQHLDGAQVGTGFQKMRGKAVSKQVGVDTLLIQAGTSAALWQAIHRTLVVTGRLDVCHASPGKSHSVGLRRSPRQ